MKRKEKQIKEKKEELVLLENELKVEKEKIEKEKEELSKKIDDMMKEKYFCGVILTKADVIEIVKLQMETKENIKIKYNIYYDEEKE